MKCIFNILTVISDDEAQLYDSVRAWAQENIDLLIGFAAVSLLLVIALIIAIYKIIRIRRKSESKLAEKNLEIRDANQKMLASINYASRIQGFFQRVSTPTSV